MYNIDIYNNSTFLLKDNSKIIYSWIIILIITLGLIFFIPITKYKKYTAYVKDSYICFYIESNDFPLNMNDKLYINDKMYNYKIVNIEKNLVQIKLDNNDIMIDNNVITINILSDKYNIFNKILKKIKKGFDL